jgi:hypothetical protein
MTARLLTVAAAAFFESAFEALGFADFRASGAIDFS